MSEQKQSGSWFILHCILLVGAWLAPFLLTWYWVIGIYALVILQFAVFGRCLMNEKHALDDSGNMTLYAYLLEKIGFRFSRAKVRVFVRSYLYGVLGLCTLYIQLVLHVRPLLF
ncbi:MAG: hypothetical protein R2794_04390 [Chitinophagales bacterium]